MLLGPLHNQREENLVEKLKLQTKSLTKEEQGHVANTLSRPEQVLWFKSDPLIFSLVSSISIVSGWHPTSLPDGILTSLSSSEISGPI